MSKYIVGKRIAAIEWYHVEAETKKDALDVWNRGGLGVEFRGQGDAEEFLDDMIVQEWDDDESKPSVLPPLYASTTLLAERVRILREALRKTVVGLQQANEGYSEDNFGDEIRAGLAALEATK